MSATCALWYWRHGFMYYTLHDSEEAAAKSATYFDGDDGAPVGVQFSDGRTLEMNNWPAYQEAKRRADETAYEWVRTAPPPRPTRTVRDPFNGTDVTVDAAQPEWLGVDRG